MKYQYVLGILVVITTILFLTGCERSEADKAKIRELFNECVKQVSQAPQNKFAILNGADEIVDRCERYASRNA